MTLKRLINFNSLVLLAILLGTVCGIIDLPIFDITASTISEIFIRLLKLVSLPIIFLSIVSTASGMKDYEELKVLGKKVLKYTLFTTLLAASLALVIFLVVQPVSVSENSFTPSLPKEGKGYLFYLIQVIPSNIVQPFLENNVMGVLLMAMFLSFAIITLPGENREVIHSVFKALYRAIMKITALLIRMMPVAIWAFVLLFIKDLKQGLEIKSIAYYLLCVILANLIQAFVVLPLFLKAKGISPLFLARSMFSALSVAFFSKSSSAALPMAIQCAEENAKVSKKVAGFTLPLCTTINMNACAAFILITVLFVSMSHGMHFTYPEMGLWIFLSTIAAVGNAGVPMGCYFLASSFLAAMNVPLHILGVILPFYTMIDMLESAINVWSDSCVTAVVNQEINQTETIANVDLNENMASVSS